MLKYYNFDLHNGPVCLNNTFIAGVMYHTRELHCTSRHTVINSQHFSCSRVAVTPPSSIFPGKSFYIVSSYVVRYNVGGCRTGSSKIENLNKRARDVSAIIVHCMPEHSNKNVINGKIVPHRKNHTLRVLRCTLGGEVQKASRSEYDLSDWIGLNYSKNNNEGLRV